MGPHGPSLTLMLEAIKIQNDHKRILPIARPHKMRNKSMRAATVSSCECELDSVKLKSE